MEVPPKKKQNTTKTLGQSTPRQDAMCVCVCVFTSRGEPLESGESLAKLPPAGGVSWFVFFSIVGAVYVDKVFEGDTLPDRVYYVSGLTKQLCVCVVLVWHNLENYILLPLLGFPERVTIGNYNNESNTVDDVNWSCGWETPHVHIAIRVGCLRASKARSIGRLGFTLLPVMSAVNICLFSKRR